MDYSVFCGEWCIGRIYENSSGPEHLRWSWSLLSPSKPESLRTSNEAATLNAAKAEFEASWKQWKAWAKLEEVVDIDFGELCTEQEYLSRIINPQQKDDQRARSSKARSDGAASNIPADQ